VIHLLTGKCEHKHWTMVLLLCAERQKCIVDMLCVVIAVVTSINFVRVYKILLFVDIFGTRNLTNNYKLK